MKRNTIIKVMSASILAASLAVVDFPTNLQQTKYIHAVGTQEVSVDVVAHLLNANNSGQRSMGDAALEKVSIKKVGNQYQYTIIWKNLKIGEQSDGVSKFWVEGKEVPLTSTTYPNVNNPKQAVFTLPELKSTLNVEVFVQTMENIMPGAGRKSAILQLDTNGVSKKLETSTTEKQNTSTDNSVQENKTTKQAETDNSAKEDASQNSTAKAAKEKAEADKAAKENTTNNTSNVNNSTSNTNFSSFRSTSKSTGSNNHNTTSQPSISPTPKGGKLDEVTYYRNVTVSLLNASNPGQRSMGDVALDGITVFRDSRNTYHYIVKFKDINKSGIKGGISRFWVRGTQYPLTYTGGGNHQVQVHFTSSEKLQQVPVSVFVQAMEDIMPGAGKKDAILSINWSNAKEEQGQADPSGGGPGGNPAGGPSGDKNSGKQANGDQSNGDSADNSADDNNDGRVDNSGEFSKTGLNNKTNFKNKTNLKSPYVIIPSAVSLLGVILIFIKRRLF